MRVPNEQDHFEFAQSEWLHEVSIFRRALYILIFYRFLSIFF